MSSSLRDIKEFVGMSGKDINDYFHHIGVNNEFYEVYRLKPTLWRIEQYGEFMFNIKAGNLRIAVDVLSRLGLTEYRKDIEKRDKVYNKEKDYILECTKIFDSPPPTEEDIKYLREVLLTDKYVDNTVAPEVLEKLKSVEDNE